MRDLTNARIIPLRLLQFVLDYLPLSLQDELTKYVELLDDASSNESITADQRELFTYAFIRDIPLKEQDQLHDFLEKNSECVKMLAYILSNKKLPIAGAGCCGYLLKDRFFDSPVLNSTDLSEKQNALIQLLFNANQSQAVRKKLTVNTNLLACCALISTLMILLFSAVCGMFFGGILALLIFNVGGINFQNFLKLFCIASSISSLLTIALSTYATLMGKIQSSSAVKVADENYKSLYKLFSFVKETEQAQHTVVEISPRILPSHDRGDIKAPLLQVAR